MKNQYEVIGETTVIFLPKKDGSFLECFIDTIDFDLINKYNTTWFAHENSVNTAYARTIVTIDRKIHRIQMHRLIFGTNDETQLVDHKDGNGLNNKRKNLRPATRKLNPQNRKKARSDSITGIRGVTFDKSSQKYKAHVTYGGKQKTLGRFNTIELAEQAVKEARKKYMPFNEE